MLKLKRPVVEKISNAQRYAVLYKVSESCNYQCEFCVEKKSLQTNRPIFISERFIRETLASLHQKYLLESIIVSGGEPTLHPSFMQLLSFFSKQDIPLKLITNMERFSDAYFLKEIASMYALHEKWKLFGSLCKYNNACVFDRIRNILSANIPLYLIVPIYEYNLPVLPIIFKKLSKIVGNHRCFLGVELRLIYTQEVPEETLFYVPKEYKKFQKVLQQCVSICASNNIPIVLWNIPVCYVQALPNSFNYNVAHRKSVKIIKIDSRTKSDTMYERDFNEFFLKTDACVLCSHNELCSGITPQYIDTYKYPEFTPRGTKCFG